MGTLCLRPMVVGGGVPTCDRCGWTAFDDAEFVWSEDRWESPGPIRLCGGCYRLQEQLDRRLVALNRERFGLL